MADIQIRRVRWVGYSFKEDDGLRDYGMPMHTKASLRVKGARAIEAAKHDFDAVLFSYQLNISYTKPRSCTKSVMSHIIHHYRVEQAGITLVALCQLNDQAIRRQVSFSSKYGCIGYEIPWTVLGSEE
jgi:hypothetical protein